MDGVRSACSRPTNATSRRRGPSWPGSPQRSRPPRRSSTASSSPPTTRGGPSFGLLQQRMHVANAAEAGRRAAGGARHLRRVRPAPPRRPRPHHPAPDRSPAAARPAARAGAALAHAHPCTTTGPRSWRPRTSAGSRASSPSASTRRYEPGKRTRTWLKVKVRRRQEMVVGGWLPGRGQPRRAASARSSSATTTARATARLALRRPGRHRLHRRRAASGSRDRRGPARHRRVPVRPAPPRADLVRGPVWVRPELVAELGLR